MVLWEWFVSVVPFLRVFLVWFSYTYIWFSYTLIQSQAFNKTFILAILFLVKKIVKKGIMAIRFWV